MKSFFTKLGTLLLCGVAVAVVGCTDFSEDIQAGDKALQDKIESVEKSTASTIAELKAAIKTLEETQAQMASDYAKKTDLETVKNDLQTALNAKIEAVAADVTSANAKIAALESGKADKSALEALAGDVDAAIKKAEDAIKALEAAKADKTQVDKIEGDVATLIEGYQQMIYQFQNLQLVVEGKADQADLDVVEGDVETLKQGYMETVLALTEIKATLETKASQTDLELTKKDVETLKEASAQAVFAITNLQTAVEVLDERVDALEEGLNAAKEQIAQHTEALQNIKQNLMTVEGDLEAEAELREKADEALQTYVDQLNYGLTNLKVAYDVHIEEYEAYKETLKKNLDDLAAADGALATSLLSYYNQAITAVEESEAKLDSLINDEINKALNVVAQQRTEIEGMIAHTEESISKAFAEADQEVITYVKDTLLTVVYNTIYDNHKTYEARFESVEAAVAAMDEEFRTVLSALQQADVNLNAYCDNLQAQLEEQKDEYLNLFSSLQQENARIEGMIEYLDAEVKGLISALTDRVAANEEAIKALEAVRDQLLADVKELQANVGQVASSVIDYYDMAITAIDEAVAALNDKNDKQDAKIEEVSKALATLRAQFDERMQHYDGFENDVANKIKELQKNLAAAETKINDLFNLIVDDLNNRIQSVVFVPDYADGKATADVYTYGDNQTQVVVKATYQVTPSNHVSKIGTELEVIGALQAVKNRVKSAADEYLFAEAAYITDVNLNNGKFDVEFVFDAEEYLELGKTVLGAFVQHPGAPVMPVDEVEDNMGVATETIFKNYKVSDFAAVVAEQKRLDYAFVKEGEDGLEEYIETTETVAWSSETPERRPYAGYKVMIQKDNDYLTLAEMAEIMHVEEAAITPKVGFGAKYFVAADVKSAEFKADAKTYASYNSESVENTPNTCNGANKVTADEKDYRVFTIGLEQTNANAIKLIGHKVTGDLYFYFAEDAEPVLHAVYNYIIDYRTYKFNVVNKADDYAAHKLDWTYDLAKKLAVNKVPNQVHINKDIDPKFSEYDVLPDPSNEGEDVDYKDIMETKEFKDAMVRNVLYQVEDGEITDVCPQGAKEIKLVIAPRTGIIHDIAEIGIYKNTYAFIDKDVTYHCTNTYTDDVETFTKVQYYYFITLGHMPYKVNVTAAPETIQYSTDIWTKAVDFATLAAQTPELAGHGFGTSYNVMTDYAEGGIGSTILYASETPTAKVVTPTGGTDLAPFANVVKLSADDQKAIFTNEAAKSSGYLTRSVTTWFGTEFIYTQPFTVEAPKYRLDINPLHVAVKDGKNIATANYLYADDNNSTYTVLNSFMPDYFRVLNADEKNILKVRFTILSEDVDKDGKVHSTPKFLKDGVPYKTEIERLVKDGSFERAKTELAWDNYHFRSVVVRAQLLVNEEEFLDPIDVTITTDNPLELTVPTDPIEVEWLANDNTKVEDVLAAGEVSIIDQSKPVPAHKFFEGKSPDATRRAAAYDAKFTVEKLQVYYYEGDKKVDVDARYYTYGDPQDEKNRTLSFEKETANLESDIFAEFKITMDYTLDNDEPVVKTITYKVPKVEK